MKDATDKLIHELQELSRMIIPASLSASQEHHQRKREVVEQYAQERVDAEKKRIWKEVFDEMKLKNNTSFLAIDKIIKKSK